MNLQTSRRQFLRGDVHLRHVPTRPPWAWEENAFTDICDRCARCVDACPQKILITGSGGYPEVDFKRGSCSFCGDCVQACKPVALDASQGRIPWAATLVIEQDCLAVRGVDCRVCGDCCEVTAIRFVPMLRSVASPHLEPGRCTGCGACIAPCPSAAIRLSLHPEQGTQQA